MRKRRDAVARAWAGPAVGLTFLGGVLGGLARADAPYPRPGSTAERVREYFTGSAGAARVSVAGQLASSLALARFTGAVAGLDPRSASPPSPAARSRAARSRRLP